jgi:hypothetical protein
MRDVSDLDELLVQLAADADQALEHDRLAEEFRQRVRANLPAARRLGAGPAKLERTIKSLYVERTISRWTAGDAPEVAPETRPKRKRPGGAPSNS